MYIRHLTRVAVSAIVAGSFVGVASRAPAIGPQPFSLSPTSGPVGTQVTVSGTGCSPGLVLTSLDHVTVSAPTLLSTFDVPVAANGSWQGTFTVSSGAPSLPIAVAALCVTDNLPSLLTVYVPQTFTVTQATTTTTRASTTPTTQGATETSAPATSPPTTSSVPGGGGGGGGATPTTSRSGPPNPGAPSAPTTSATPGDDSPGATPSPGSGSDVTAPDADDGDVAVDDAIVFDGDSAIALDAASARRAHLDAPELAAETKPSSGGLAWLWLLLLLATGGTAAAVFWYRRFGRHDESPATEGDPS